MSGARTRWAVPALCATSLALAACGRADRARGADSSASAAPAAARALASRTSARIYPGALTKPIDAYSGDELYELARSLHFAGSHERQRRCRNAAGCEGTGAKRTLVQVSGVATQDSLSAGDLPEFGAIHVRAINRGDAEEARYGMRPGNSLRYYVIVTRDSARALVWRLEELDTTPPRRHMQIATGHVVSCGHSWTAGARADFRSCAQGDRSDTVTTLSLVLQEGFGDPIWMMCDNGCCTLMQ